MFHSSCFTASGTDAWTKKRNQAVSSHLHRSIAGPESLADAPLGLLRTLVPEFQCWDPGRELAPVRLDHDPADQRPGFPHIPDKKINGFHCVPLLVLISLGTLISSV